MSTQLVVCGSIALDRIMNFTGGFHELIDETKLEVLSVSVLVDSLKISNGGTGANIAYNLSNLGNHPVLLGAVGPDAQEYLQQLEAKGTDVSHVYRSKLPTASFSVLTDSHDNQVGGFYPGAMGDADSLSFTPWAGQDVLFCLSAHDPTAMRRQIDESAHNKLRLFYDPGQQVSNISVDDLKAGVAAAEVLIVNDYERTVVSKKLGLSEIELAQQVPVFISTHGKDGSVISGQKLPEPVKIAAAKPTDVVDPTGAGDAYRAGFLHGYLRQWDIKQCGQLGSVVASFVLEQAGTQIDLPVDVIKQRYQATYNQEVDL